MKAIDILKQLAIEEKKKKTTLPDHAIPKPKYSDKDANGLTKCILDYLNLSGHYAVRINTQGQYNENLGRWTKSMTRRGTADIHACVKGHHISIEVKYGADRMSKYQIDTKQSIEDAEGVYMIARRFQQWYDDFQELQLYKGVRFIELAVKKELDMAETSDSMGILKRILNICKNIY